MKNAFNDLMIKYPLTNGYYREVIKEALSGNHQAFKELEKVLWAHHCEDNRFLQGMGFEDNFRLSDETANAIEEAFEIIES